MSPYPCQYFPIMYILLSAEVVVWFDAFSQRPQGRGFESCLGMNVCEFYQALDSQNFCLFPLSSRSIFQNFSYYSSLESTLLLHTYNTNFIRNIYSVFASTLGSSTHTEVYHLSLSCN